MFRRLIRDPKLGTFHGQPCYQRTFVIVVAKRFSGAESRLVELDRLRPVSHRQHRRYHRFMFPCALRLAAHETLSRVEVMVAFSGADHGCGLRSSMKAKMVMSSARTVKAPARTTVMPVSFSGVPKQPPLMSMCRRYARGTTARNPAMIPAKAVSQIRKRPPGRISKPTT